MGMDPVRFSRLKKMAASPAHYLADDSGKTRCMETGSAVDALVFGTKPVICYPGKVRNGKEWEKFRDDPENASSMIVTRSELAEAEGMAESVRAHPRAVEVLKGQYQKEIDWKFLGRDCQSHLDVTGPGFDYVTELKSCNTSKPEMFRWKALRMQYNAQLAFYGDAVRYVSGVLPKDYFIVCVESKSPYVVTVYRLTERAMDLGRRSCRLWMERLLQCEGVNYWPGYSDAIVDLDASDDDFGFGDESATEGWEETS
jgi:hypothetical protein